MKNICHIQNLLTYPNLLSFEILPTLRKNSIPARKIAMRKLPIRVPSFTQRPLKSPGILAYPKAIGIVWFVI